ncbi:uncharacterized protein LOC144307035 isoform X3 [Canis aureus]
MEDCPSLIQSNAHIYSDLPASVRSERGLPRESGLVLCSPECPSGARTAPHSWHIKTHPLEIPQKWEASPFLSGQDASVYSLIPVLGPSLTVLDLSSCVALTNRTLQAIRASLTHLSVLRLAWCKELRDWGLLGLGDPSDEPTQEPQEHLRAKLRRNLKSRSFFPQLHQELEHQALGPKDPSPQPQGSSLLMLRALRELDLTACSKLTDASLAKVLQFPELRQLSLRLLPALTDKGLVAVARGCPSLERLVLSHCSLLSNEGWSQAASSWPRLQHLNLASCGQLTEQTLDTVGQACKQLQMLDVAMCPRISMAAVRCFQAQLPQPYRCLQKS